MSWPDLSTALALSCIIGTLSAYLAVRRGRNPYAWFFIGVFFGLLGMIAIFFAPAKKVQKQPIPAPPPEPEPIILGPSDKFWYYLDPAHQRMGPMSFDALNKAWKQGKITVATYVWNEELSDWKPLQDLIRM